MDYNKNQDTNGNEKKETDGTEVTTSAPSAIDYGSGVASALTLNRGIDPAREKAVVVKLALTRRYQMKHQGSRASSSGDDETTESSPSELGATKTATGHFAIPCEAKGMPVDHNSRTAYFLIKGDVRHGHHLICSHLLCQNEGVKFLYCTYCKAPVTKLNFGIRHNHTNKETGSDGSHEGSKLQQDAGKGGIPMQVTTKKLGMNDESGSNRAKSKGKKVSSSSSSQPAYGSSETGADETNSARASSSSSPGSENSSFRQQDPSQAASGVRSSRSRPGGNSAASTSENSYMCSFENLGTKRRYEWATLLSKRPRLDDREEMSAWLHDVLEVSNLNEPLKVTDSSLPSNESSSETRGTNNSSTDASAPTDRSGTSSSRTDTSSSANDSSSDAREPNNRSTDESSPTDGSSNDSTNDSSSETQEANNGEV